MDIQQKNKNIFKKKIYISPDEIRKKKQLTQITQ